MNAPVSFSLLTLPLRLPLFTFMSLPSRWATLAVIILSMCSGQAAWGSDRSKNLVVTDAYMNLLPNSKSVSAVFLKLENKSSDIRSVVSVRSPAARAVELHESRHVEGMMKMRRLSAVKVPAGETLEFRHGGYHLMVFGIHRDLSVGGSLPFVFTLDDGKTLEFSAEIKKFIVGD